MVLYSLSNQQVDLVEVPRLIEISFCLVSVVLPQPVPLHNWQTFRLEQQVLVD
jgi:hypothetical protein